MGIRGIRRISKYNFNKRNAVLFSVLALTLVFSAFSVLFPVEMAHADNFVTTTSSITFDIASSGTADYKLVATSANQPGGDPIDGCNVPPLVTFTFVSDPPGVTADPLIFNSCSSSNKIPVTFTPSVPGK